MSKEGLHVAAGAGQNREAMKRIPTIVMVVATVVLLAIAGALNHRLRRMRSVYQGAPMETLENTPPLMAFTTIVLGGFRGLIADALWLRATRLQDEQRYFELVQLADWITKFEPRATQTWAYHAWNMAYNVSRMMATPTERWRWIRNGIALLRDEGLRYNPGDTGLYFELGWLYQHKIGTQWDRDHRFYKQQLAREFHALFGGPRPDYAALANRPAILKALREKHHLLPRRMRAAEERFGPLDWRLPETHAIYWALSGQEAAPAGGELRLDRMIYQSLSMLVFNGYLDFDPKTQRYERSPDLSVLPRAVRAYEEALEHHAAEGTRTGLVTFLQAAERLATHLDDEEALGRIQGLRAKYEGAAAPPRTTRR